MPRPMSPIEMIPTVVARMVVGIYGRMYRSKSMKENGCLIVGKDLAESAKDVFSGCAGVMYSHISISIVSMEPISSVCIRAESVRGIICQLWTGPRADKLK